MDTVPPIIRGSLASSDLKIKIAWLYHVEGMTQEAIASLLEVNRSKVMRSLAASAAENMVITTINAKTTDQIDLERRLEKFWRLESAIVVPTPSDARHLERSIGHAVANYVNDHFTDGMTIAVGGGATLHSSLDFMRQRKLRDAYVIGLVGSLAYSKWINPSIVASNMAQRLGVDSYQISAPVVLDDPNMCERLWSQPMLKDVRDRVNSADIAILTVGEVAPTATMFKYGIVPRSLIAPLQKLGAVANILCYFVDADGQLVDHQINRSVMAIPPSEVASLKRVILAAGGAHKVKAIRAALKSVKAKILITDSDSARALLKD